MHEPSILYLDSEYNLQPGSWIAIEKPDSDNIIRYVKLQERNISTRSLAAYGLTGRTTRLDLDETQWIQDDDFSTVRGTVVYVQSEELELAEVPIEEPIGTEITGTRIELDGLYEGLEVGRWLIVSGERVDVVGVKSAELVMLAGIEQSFDSELPGDKTHTVLVLANSLAYKYKRDTVTIYGNVVKATHGETHQDVLGSGDGSQAFQQFTLRHSPLTYLAAPTPSGAQSTLDVRVNQVRWHEAESVVGLEPTDRRFITRTDNQHKTTIIFGNGENGARLPSGMENVTATYRSGIGKPGNVKAEQISQLASKPLGVKGVINPLPATGGANPESRDRARKNVPLAVMSLDRLVSVQDYADFARTFAGIGKASATRLSDGRQQIVHLTITGAEDIPINQNSDLYRNLTRSLHQFGDPEQPIQVAVRELMLLIIVAKVRVLPDYLWESVEPKIRATLLDTFSFERRELGQDVPLSEVISTMQQVPGVAYVDLDILDSLSEAEAENS
ncbi:MAG: putative baseplate assembly protein, partial [Coleofasciculus sp. C2-GNP5-27]